MKSTMAARLKISQRMQRMPRHGATNESFLVSTTNNIEGYTISSHLGIVSGHIVLGANIILDFLASVSDVVGGRSAAYENQLILSYDKVVANLQDKAKEKGGNALVGLKIDHDHISGKGKSMFMVNAFATAVKVDILTDESNPYALNLQTKEIPCQLLRQISHQMKMIKLINESPDKLQIENLSLDSLIFIADNSLGIKIKKPILRYAEMIYDGKHDEFMDYAVAEIINSVKEDEKNDFLYDLIDSSVKSYPFFVDIVKDNKLLDFDRIKKLLFTKEIINIEKAIGLLFCDKLMYTEKDVVDLTEIIFSLSALAENQSVAQALKANNSLKCNPEWTCASCGCLHNESDNCSECGKSRSIYEVEEEGVKSIIQKVLNFCKNKKESIEMLFQADLDYKKIFESSN